MELSPTNSAQKIWHLLALLTQIRNQLNIWVNCGAGGDAQIFLVQAKVLRRLIQDFIHKFGLVQELVYQAQFGPSSVNAMSAATVMTGRVNGNSWWYSDLQRVDGTRFIESPPTPTPALTKKNEGFSTVGEGKKEIVRIEVMQKNGEICFMVLPPTENKPWRWTRVESSNAQLQCSLWRQHSELQERTFEDFLEMVDMLKQKLLRDRCALCGKFWQLNSEGFVLPLCPVWLNGVWRLKHEVCCPYTSFFISLTFPFASLP